MTFVWRVLAQPASGRLGWTLLQFLWQGAAIAVALAMALRLMDRHSAQMRYGVSCLAMLLLAISPVATWTVLSRQPSPDRIIVPLGAPPSIREMFLGPEESFVPALDQQTRAITDAPGNPEVARSRSDRARDFFDRLAPWLAMGWAAMVLLLSLRLLGGWMGAQTLRRRALAIADQRLLSRVAELARCVGIRRMVRVLRTAARAGPAVIGVIRPAILLPASVLTELPALELEAILVHELVHIRRHDYLINLLQIFIETLLFYHPAVWWVSRRIRLEREHCCDDIAADVCGDRSRYATALADLYALQGTAVPLAPGAAGTEVLSRIRRILQVPSAPRQGGGAWAGGVLVAVVVFASLGLNAVRAGTPRFQSPLVQQVVAAPITDNGQSFHIVRLELPAPIARQIVQQVGYNPLDKTSAEISPQGPFIVGPNAYYVSRNGKPYGWAVSLDISSFAWTTTGFMFVGELRIIAHPPGRLYAVPFHADVRTSPAGARHSDELDVVDGQITWSRPRTEAVVPPPNVGPVGWSTYSMRPYEERRPSGDRSTATKEMADDAHRAMLKQGLKQEQQIKALIEQGRPGPERDRNLKRLEQLDQTLRAQQRQTNPENRSPE